jgi:drug/metabolite transporter (DMT)-like permease
MPPAGGPAAPARSMLPPALNAKPMTARAAPHPAPLVFPVLGALLVVAWSSGFVGIRYASDEAPIATILLWRSLVSGLVLLPFALWLGPRIPARALAEQALFAFLGMVLYLGGFALAIGWRVPTGLVALMADLVPLAIAALSWPVLGQRVGPRQWLGMAIGTLGVLAVSADALRLGDAPPLAYALPILGMLAFAVSTVLQRRMRVTELPIHQALCLQCLFAAALFALPAAATGALVPPMRNRTSAPRSCGRARYPRGEGMAARGREMAVADLAGMGAGRGGVLGIALREARDRRGAKPDQHLGPVVGIALEVAPQHAAFCACASPSPGRAKWSMPISS